MALGLTPTLRRSHVLLALGWEYRRRRRGRHGHSHCDRAPVLRMCEYYGRKLYIVVCDFLFEGKGHGEKKGEPFDAEGSVRRTDGSIGAEQASPVRPGGQG